MANVDEIINSALASVDICTITEGLKESVFIGSEFTFRIDNKEFSMEDLETKGVSSDINTAIENYVTELSTIINKMPGLYCTLEQKDGKWRGFKPHILTIVSKSLNKPVCWICYDVDPNCMELQMQPITYNEYEKNAQLLQEIIFRIACKKGFKPVPDITGGGGHISFSKNIFDDDVDNLIKFIILYSLEVSEGELGVFEDFRRCNDNANAPILTKEQMQVFKKLNPAAKASIDNFVQFINENIYIEMNEDIMAQYISIEQKKGRHVNLNDLKRELGRHYQAINLEHMTERDARLRRIEMRRFDAQSDIYEFLRQVESLYLLYAAAKIIPMANVLDLI